MRYEALMEQYLDESYERYKKKNKLDRVQEDDIQPEKRKRLRASGELSEEEELDADDFEAQRLSDDELDDLGERGGGLLVRFEEGRAGRATSSKALARQWFGQDVFQDAAEDVLDEEDEEDGADASEEEEDDEELEFSDDGMEEEEEEEEEPAPRGKKRGGKADSDDDEQRQIDRLKAARAASTSGATPGGVNGKKGGKKGRQGSGTSPRLPSLQCLTDTSAVAWASCSADPEFEVVPLGGDSSDSDSSSGSETDTDDEFELLPPNAKAEVLAMAKKMLRGKDRQHVMDAAYSRCGAILSDPCEAKLLQELERARLWRRPGSLPPPDSALNFAQVRLP